MRYLGILLTWLECGALCSGSDWNTSPFMNFPNFGKSDLDQLTLDIGFIARLRLRPYRKGEAGIDVEACMYVYIYIYTSMQEQI